MDKKAKFEAFIAEKGKAAKNLIDNAITAIDQNDDGKFDLADVSVVAEAMGNAAIKGAQLMKESAEEKARLNELKALRPLFPHTLDNADFSMPKFIRVTERTKKYVDSEACRGSVGYLSTNAGLNMVNIFWDSVDAFDLTFYPNADYEFYYVDPSDRNSYIALNEYFNFLKIARINELKRIAQALGAKHCCITYKEEQTSFYEKKGKASAKAVAKADAEHQRLDKKFSTTEIAAEMNFPGHAPIEPQLKYIQKDTNVQTLIAMRMADNIPNRYKDSIEMSNSSGLKESDAVKIDAALKGLKLAGNATVASEVKNEARRYLEYEIDF